MQNVRIRGSFARYFVHNIDERVKRFFTFRFSGLDHKGLVEKQREVDGRSVETVVQQALRHIEGGRSWLAGRAAVVDQPVEHEFVFADRRNREFVSVLHQGYGRSPALLFIEPEHEPDAEGVKRYSYRQQR